MSAVNANRPRPGARGATTAVDLKRWHLEKVDIFGDLAPPEIEAIEQGFRMSPHVPPGRTVFRPEDSAEGLFILKQGAVRIYKLSPDGKRFVVGDIGPGTFFGEMAMVGQSMYGSFAETVEDSCICVMSQTDLERLVQRHPSVGVRIMRAMAQRLFEAERQMEDLALKSVTSRLATFILQHASTATGHMTGFTHADIADRVGTTRETATQAIDIMRNQALIRVGRQRIQILNTDLLQATADDY